MTSARSVGRLMGVLFLAQGAITPLIYFRLLRPGNGAQFLQTAAAHASEVRTALLLAFVSGLLTIGIALAAWPVLRRHSERHALAYVALAVTAFAALAMENLILRQMLAASEQAARGLGREALEALAPLMRESWRQAHFTTLLLAHATGLVLHLALLRFGLVPRIIPAAGVAAALFSMGAVAAPLLGGTFAFSSMGPIGVVQLALVGWLLVRGLDGKPDGPAPRMGMQ